MKISLQPLLTRGIQKQRMPVKKYRQTDQEMAAHPGSEVMKSFPTKEQTGQGRLHSCMIRP